MGSLTPLYEAGTIFELDTLINYGEPGVESINHEDEKRTNSFKL